MFGTDKDGHEGAAWVLAPASLDRVIAPGEYASMEVAELRAQLDAARDELFDLRARARENGERMLELSGNAARFETMCDMLRQNGEVDKGLRAEVEELQRAIEVTRQRIDVKDLYIGELEQARDQVLADCEELARHKAAFANAEAEREALAEQVHREVRVRFEAEQLAAAMADTLARHRADRAARAEEWTEHEARLNSRLEAAAVTAASMRREREQLAGEMAQLRARAIEADTQRAEIAALEKEMCAILGLPVDVPGNLPVTERLRLHVDESRRSIEQHQAALAEAQARAERAEAGLLALGDDIARAEADLAAQARDRAELANRLAGTEADRATALEAVDALRCNLDQVEREMSRQAMLLAAITAENLTLRDNVWRKDSELAATMAHVDALRAALARQADESAEAVARAEACAQGLESQLANAEMRYSAAMAENLTLRDNVWRKDNSIAALHEEIAAAAANVDEQQRCHDEALAESMRSCANLEAEAGRTGMKYMAAMAENLSLRDNVWRKDNEIGEIRQELVARQAELESVPWNVLRALRMWASLLPPPVYRGLRRLIAR